MKRPRQTIGLGVLLAIALAACGVDEFSNPQRQTAAECARSGGTLLEGKFCVPDAGSPDPQRCTEEGASELCYDGADLTTSLQPPCRAGSRTCRDGVWSDCEQQVLPEDETCNGSDDDCDGRIDEHMDPMPCALDELSGACARGVLLCLAGHNDCVQIEHPSDDVCNGEDDDCDGQVDEGTAQTCYDAEASGCAQDADGNYDCQGACTTGEIRCIDGAYATSCDGSVTPEADERCSSDIHTLAQDEDCDGQVDEGCTCLEGTTCYTGSPTSTEGTGPCHAGHKTCSDATHGVCVDEVKPSVEDCSNEGRDDDCDGTMDDVPARGQSCASESKAKGACKAGALWQCKDGKQVCVDAPASNTETCDGVDEDCDGHIDEGFALDSDPKNCGACGKECGAGLVCCAGDCVDTTSSNSNCNGCGKACATGNTCCSSSCINTTNDVNNCGQCGNKCTGVLGVSCSNSACSKILL